ncbi:MAG: DUF1549 and DUF1553 domain-containing protein [Verrucomicrobiota bacterium]|nr:DUF1549 and DUF1553 domain-containing protein [Verrucomicrobiota bacterium]MED5456929.1 DUF1549 and DUF1553 domain-containing protein [Verrucomicrobiota bacterium]MEE2724732.1 DUF1549 and DUF1553 domain-containing protein [Verrucomicrobiota bacterium]
MSFTRDVMPVLSKAGCNGGGCHGNQNGKGGFKLSLWGENPTLDHKNILSSEKRANPSNPEVSKLLRKPTLLEKHEGDKRFDLESEEYRILHDWLKLGAKNDIDSAPQLESIRIIPSSVLLSAPNKKINLQVKAKFSNGEEKDVSQWAVYESANLGAEVSAGGELEFSQPGETTVFVRYMGGRASMRAALIKANDNYKWKGPSPKNEIDHYVFSKLKLFNQNPSAVSDDLTFLRRVSLDVTGSLPSSDTARSFLSDKRKDKRSILIEELLKSEEYASFWALKWADLLRVEEKTLDSKGVEKIYGWLKEMIGSGKPLDQFTKDILCATGSTYNNPPANFYRALRAPVNRAEAVAQVFIGTRINCAKCHDHPFENVRQDDYYRFAAIFDAIDYEIIENKRKDGFDKHRFVGEQVIKLVSADKFQNKFLKDPRTKKPPEPGFLDSSSGPIKSFDNRLEEVADWITSHPRFAKVQANRIWSNLVGQPLVDPIDDVRETNPASNPELLQFLSKELIESGFDQKHLIRLITNSITYQLSSDPRSVLNIGTDLTFARAKVMRYPAEVIIDAAHKSMSIEGEFSDSFKSKYAITMPGVDSVHLSKNPHENDKFLKIFGKPARLTNSDAERSNETTLAQVFELTAGKTLNTILSHQENKIGQLLKNGKDDLEIIDELYWSILTRPPVDEEWSAFLSYLNLSSNRRSALEDVAWSLLNAKEFLLRR